MQIQNPEPLLQHLEKTAAKMGTFAGWYISERLLLLVEDYGEGVEYTLACDTNEAIDIQYQDLSRNAALHWLREAK